MRFDIGVVATHIYPALGYGGVSVSAFKLTQAWGNQFDIKICLCSSDASEKGLIISDDVKLNSNVKVLLYRAYFFKRWGFGLGAIMSLYYLCKNSKRVYIHGVATWPTTLAAFICVILRTPFVVAPRGGLMKEHVEFIKNNKSVKHIFYKNITYPLLRRSNLIHCTSEIEAMDIKNYIKPAPPTVIYPNGIKLNGYPKISLTEISKNNLIMSYVGRISHEKGINSFLKAWLTVKRSNDLFLIAGGSAGLDGDIYFKEFLELVKQSKGAIVYRGYIDEGDVNKMVQESHYLVLPSGLEGDVRENFGNVVAESLTLGRPVIVSSGLACDFLHERGIGLIFDRNVRSAEDVILRAINQDSVSWAKMALDARRYAEEFLDISKISAGILVAIEMATGGNDSSSTLIKMDN